MQERDALDDAVAERFWSKVDRTGECWTWTGARHPKGYGWFRIDGRLQVAHRVAWLLVHGAPPVGQLKRTCSTPACVRPEHYRDRPRTAVVRARRLPRGAGHIRQRSPGTWTVEITGGVDPLDRRRKTRDTFTVRGSFDDALAAAEAYRAHARTGDRIDLAARAP